MSEGEHQYLKGLVLEYIRTKDPAIFKDILIKVDKLLLQTIHRVRWQLPYLRKVEMQDLYQDAVVGCHKGLLKVKSFEPDTKVLYWIVRNVKDELFKCNKRRKEVAFSNYFNEFPPDGLVDNTPVYKNHELNVIRDRFWKLIDEEVLSLDEFQMLSMRIVQGMTYGDIAKQFGSTRPTISKKIADLLNRLRYEFRRRNWEGI